MKKLESWIYQIARNAIIDAYRELRPTTTLEAAEVLALPEELPDEDVVSELLPCIRAMVRSLPEHDRQALVLTEYQGLTQKELSERLGLSFSGAKSRVQRAREKLKQRSRLTEVEEKERNHAMSTVPTDDEQLRAEVSARYARTALQVFRNRATAGSLLLWPDVLHARYG